MKVVFGKLEEMLAELKEKGITEVRVDALFRDRRTEHEGIMALKAFVAVGAILESNQVAHFEEVVFKNLKPFRKEELAQVTEENLQAENQIKQTLAEQGFTVRNGYFAEAIA